MDHSWDNYWMAKRNGEEVFGWDDLSELLLRTLVRIAPKSSDNIKILEIGSGSGKVSAALADLGHRVTCLDSSQTSLQIAKCGFEFRKVVGEFVCADLRDIPLGNGSFDLVWSSGVLEHFHSEDQVLALEEMARLLGVGGKIVVIVPYKLGLIYRLGKAIAELRGKWDVGYEVPLATLRDLCPPRLRISEEYVIAFRHQLFFLPFGKYCIRIVEGRRFGGWFPSLIKRILGGYLLVSILEASDHRSG